MGETVSFEGSRVSIRREPWDCLQLGIEAGKVEHLEAGSTPSARAVLAQGIERARQMGLVHLAARILTTDRRGAEALQASGFRLVDTVVHLELPRVELKQVTVDGITLRWATNEDTSAIGSLAASAFSDRESSFNRYLNDSRLSDTQVRRVYETWGATSVAGAAAEATLIAEVKSVLAGFLSLQGLSTATPRVPLNAVSAASRRRGIYRALVVEAARSVFGMHAQTLSVTTQLQQAAVLRTWLSLGAKLVGSSYSFHLWLDDAAG